MRVKIWGSRGSIPAPLTSSQVEEKIVRAISEMPELDTEDESAVRAYVRGLSALNRGTAGGNTTCIEVRTGGSFFVIDAGTGIRELGIELMKGPFGRGEGELHLLFSHPHWDHIQGFPYFTPAFIPGNRITIYSVHDLQEALVEQQRSLNFPVPMSAMEATIEFVTLEAGQPFSVGDININTIRNAHPGVSYAYRIEDEHSSFVFASDSEYKNLDDASMQPHLDFFHDAGALIFDAQYTLGEGWVNEDWGHSSAMIGVEMALAARVQRLLLFHHDPTNDDLVLQQIVADAKAYRDELGGHDALEIMVAHEGLVLDITPAGSVGTTLEERGGAPILVPSRVFDEQSVQQMAEKLVILDETADSTQGRIIDLSQVETLTTASLKKLVKLQQAQGRAPLVLAAPSTSALRVIELGGLSDFFAIYPSIEAAQAAVSARASAQLPGHILADRYLIQRELASGNMGTILLASDQETGNPVTIHIIDPAYSEETRQRLFSQRDTLLSAEHANLLPLHDLAAEEEVAYLVEGYSAGKTLDKVMADYPQGMPVARAMELALAIVDGIRYAHAQGIVHGNLKTDKIYIDNGSVQIGGLALGRLDEGLDLREVPIIRQEVAYLAPEQVTGRPIDARTDLYALGVILFQIFSGDCPFQGSEREVLQAHLDQKPPSPADLNQRISPSQAHLILKLLDKSPAHRYGSAAQVRRILSALNVGDVSTLVEEETLIIGRENELKLLRELWQKARSGQGQLVFISGEQGVGKSRLAEELARQVQAPVVLVGRGLERRGSRAFAPIAEALLAYLRTVPPELMDDHAQKLIRDFSAVMPDMQELLPDLKPPAPLDPEQERLRRMNSMTRFIALATANRPWILILDDLQWADDSSLALLRYLCFDLPQMPLLILASYRAGAKLQEHPLRDLLSGISGHESVSQIELDRFDKFDLVELILSEWDSQIPPELLDTIFDHTGGNPLFIREVIQSLVAENLVTFEDGAWHYPKSTAVQLPQSLQDIVRRRVDTLDSTTQTLLQQAAVLGQEFRIDVLQEMSDLSEWPLLENLDVALQEGFIRETGGEGIFRFEHHDIRLALYEAMPAVRRRLWHKIAGETLEHFSGHEPEAIAEILAIHFIEAELAEKAIHYSCLAAQQAQAAYNNEAAVEWYRQVVSLLDGLDAQQQEAFAADHAAALLNLGKVLELVGEWDQAVEKYKNSMELARAQVDKSAVAWSQIALGELFRKQGLFEEALECLEDAGRGLKEIGDNEGLAQTLQFKGVVSVQQADLQTAHDYFVQSLALRRELGNEEGIAHLLNNLAIVAEYRGEFEESMNLHEQALALRRELGERRAIAVSLNNFGYLMLIGGDYEPARKNIEESIALYREIGDRWSLAQALGNLGAVARETGNLDEARKLYAESLVILLDLQDPWAKAYLLDDVARLVYVEGDAKQALRLIGAAMSLRSSIAAPLPGIEQQALDDFRRQLEADLGDAAGDVMAGGEALGADDALRLALELVSKDKDANLLHNNRSR